MLSDGKAPSAISQAAPANIIRDMYMLEFLDLPEPYREYDLKKAILKNMKKFLLEFGRDFIFMGEEYHLQVGKNDYYTDLIFFHRELQCLVAIELKIDDFKPAAERQMYTALRESVWFPCPRNGVPRNGRNQDFFWIICI